MRQNPDLKRLDEAGLRLYNAPAILTGDASNHAGIE
jgi:hypothetical protein